MGLGGEKRGKKAFQLGGGKTLALGSLGRGTHLFKGGWEDWGPPPLFLGGGAPGDRLENPPF